MKYYAVLYVMIAKKEKRITAYIDHEVKKKLEKKAKKHGRSVSNMAAQILTFELNKDENITK